MIVLPHLELMLSKGYQYVCFALCVGLETGPTATLSTLLQTLSEGYSKSRHAIVGLNMRLRRLLQCYYAINILSIRLLLGFCLDLLACASA